MNRGRQIRHGQQRSPEQQWTSRQDVQHRIVQSPSIPLWTCHRRTICAGLLPYLSLISSNLGSCCKMHNRGPCCLSRAAADARFSPFTLELERHKPHANLTQTSCKPRAANPCKPHTKPRPSAPNPVLTHWHDMSGGRTMKVRKTDEPTSGVTHLFKLARSLPYCVRLMLSNGVRGLLAVH